MRKGYCPSEDVFERTEVGETAVYECSRQGSYVGTRKRRCVLGAKDGEWQKASGFCLLVKSFVLIVVAGIVLIADAVYMVMTGISIAKAAGCMKDKNKKTMKKVAPKKTTKSVKI